MPTLNYSTENSTKDKRIFEIILQSKSLCSHYIQKNWDKFMVMIETYVNNYDKSFKEYKQLCFAERVIIEICLSAGISQNKIAAILNRKPSTINYEIKNKRRVYQLTTKYQCNYAQEITDANKHKSIGNSKGDYARFIEYLNCGELDSKWDIEQIILQFKKLYPNENIPHKTTVYRWLEQGRVFLGLLHYKVKKYKKRVKNKHLAGGKKSIHDREIGMDDYVTIGHYEIDTIYNGQRKGGILTLNHRATAKLYAIQIPNRNAKTIVLALRKLIKDNNLQIKSITSDNGSEFANWKIMEKEHNLQWFFADPYSPWQRAQNERLNRDIRKYFNKGCDLNQVNEHKFNDTIEKINNYCRKRWNGFSANEMEKLYN